MRGTCRRAVDEALRCAGPLAAERGSGLPGTYTLILVDGKRQSTRESRVNGNAGFEQSFTPPTGAVERIEVVRGPMSSLYGSDAIGGVINIITKKVPESWGGSFAHIAGARRGNAHDLATASPRVACAR